MGAGRVALGTTAGVAAIMLLAFWPETLHACPVCFDRDDEARIAFLATTGLLTLLPLGLVAGVGAWLRKRAGQEEEGGRPEDSYQPEDGEGEPRKPGTSGQ